MNQTELVNLDQHAKALDAGYQAWRMLCHQLHNCLDGVPAPELYKVLGVAKLEAWAMGEALTLLSTELLRSLITYDVTDHGNATKNAGATAKELHAAATKARAVGNALEIAQGHISAQGHNGLTPKLTDKD